MSAVDKRRYYLMLSPSMGQEFAVSGGFSSPSEDVQEAETFDIVSRWTLLTTAGILQDIIQTADWFCQLDTIMELSEDERDHLHKTLVSHSIGLINNFLDSGKLILVIDSEEFDNE